MTTWPRRTPDSRGIGFRLPRGVWARRPGRAALSRAGLRAWAGAAAPTLVVALALVLAAWVYYVRFGFDNRPWGLQSTPSAVPISLAFNDLGHRWASRVGDQADAVAVSGYDGQFYYYIAQNPSMMAACARGPAGCPIDASPLREERILYPMTARLLSLGDSDALHVALFTINFLAILITALLVGRLCVEAGASRWLGVAAAIFVGELQGLQRDLADPYAVMWTVLAVYFLRKDRPLLCAAAVGAAALTREQLVFVLPLLVLPWLVRRRWGTVVAFALIALGPFVAWQAALRAIFGHWGLEGSMATTHGLHWPFEALWQYRDGVEFGLTLAFVALPLVGAALVALAWLRRHGARALLADPVPFVVLLNAFLATLTAYAEWEGTWASARLVAPFVVLAIVVSCGVAAPLRRGYVALLAASAVVIFLTPGVLI